MRMTERNNKIKAFNRPASIGDLYDARTLNIINGISLFNNENYENFIKSIDSTGQNTTYIDNESSNEKFRKLDISASMKVDLKVFNTTGSGKFLTEDKKSKKSIMVTLYHYVKTKYERIYLTDENVKKLINHDTLTNNENATHVIIGIQWGANSVATFENENNENIDKKQIKGDFDTSLSNAFSTILDINAKADLDYNNNKTAIESKFKLSFVSDIIAKNKPLPQNIQDVKDYFTNIPTYLHDVNKGKGIPLEYTLFEIDALLKLLKHDSLIVKIIKDIEFNTMDQLNNELCSLSDAKQELNDYVQDINQKENKKLFDDETVKSANDMKRNVETKESQFNLNLKPILDSVRSGEKKSSEIHEFLNEFMSTDYSSQGIHSYLNKNLKNKEKLDKINNLKRNNINFLIQNPDSFHLNTDNKNKNVFILFA